MTDDYVKGRQAMGPDHHLLWVGDPEHWAVDQALPSSNPLIAVTPDGQGAWILTGVFMGRVSVSYHAGPAPVPRSLDEWEDIVQVLITPRSDEVVITPIGGDGWTSVNLAWPDAHYESYTVRCAARGRDIDPDGVGPSEEEGLFEFYQVDVWPSRAHDVAEVVKLTSQFGQREAAAKGHQ